MKLDASPFARKRMTDKDRLLVRMAQPEDHTCEVMYLDGWSVRIHTPRPRHLVGQSDKFYTFGGGFAAAVKAMTERAA